MIRTVVISAALSIVPAFAIAAGAPAQPFQREATVKALGYDPEAVVDLCKAATQRTASATAPVTAAPETNVTSYLKRAGELGARNAACRNAALSSRLEPFAKPGDQLSASICTAAAAGAGEDITAHVSDMMGHEHPDIVAAYVDGVANALVPIRDACTASKETWAKVATQVLLFENRATALRQGRVCALWRLALDKELKAATSTGENKGRAAGRAYFQTRTTAALDGAHHYCGEDSASGLIDANVGLTKMLIDSMSEK
jgi:hypothetical protein